MATVAMGVVGAGIGAYFGNPAMGWAIGTTLAGVLFPPRQGRQSRGKLDDVRVTGAGYGVMIPYQWGNNLLGGNIIWVKNNRLDETSSSRRTGGKGTRQSERVYTYTFTGAVMWAGNPVGRYKYIYGEDVLLWDMTAGEGTESPYNITNYFGDEVQVPNSTMAEILGAANTPAYRGRPYSVFVDLPLEQWGNRVPQFKAETDPGDSMFASSGQILADLFGRVGLQASEYDVGAAIQSVDGFAIGSRQELYGAIETLLEVFNLDLTEVDGQIKAVLRGGSSVVTIPADDLGAVDEGRGEPPPKVTGQRMNDLELPRRLDFNYFSTARNFGQATAGAVRPSKVGSEEPHTVDSNVLMTEDAARRVAYRILYREWVQRETLQFSLGPKYLYLAPGDVVTIPVGENLLRVRLHEVNTPLFGPISFTGVLDDVASLTQTVVGQPISGVTILGTANDSAIRAWSGPALRDADALAVGFYYGVAGTEAGDWPGATLYISWDDGTSYQILETIADPIEYGIATTALPPADGIGTGAIDTINSVDVTMVRGTPVSTSDADMFAGSNAIRIGEEVLQYATVVSLGGGSYRLSRLLRGRRGTDSKWGSHVAGEGVVLLNFGQVRRLDLDDSKRGKTALLKAVGRAQTLGSVSPVSVYVSGEEFTPYAPFDGRTV